MKSASTLAFVAFLMTTAFAQNTSQAPQNAPKARQDFLAGHLAPWDDL